MPDYLCVTPTHLGLSVAILWDQSEGGPVHWDAYATLHPNAWWRLLRAGEAKLRFVDVERTALREHEERIAAAKAKAARTVPIRTGPTAVPPAPPEGSTLLTLKDIGEMLRWPLLARGLVQDRYALRWYQDGVLVVPLIRELP